MTREHLYCDCHEPFHQLVFDYDPEERDLMIYHRMTPFLPWYKRLWVAYCYVTGRDCKRIQYTETYLGGNRLNGNVTNDSIRGIRDLLNKVLDE